MQFTHILGIDISKDTIDLALSHNKSHANTVNSKFSNNLKGYKALLTYIKEQGVKLEQVLVCLENTGIYHRPLVVFLQKQQMFVWIENAVEIKWSIGLQRGKNDKVDAQRICLYAFRHQDKAQDYTAKDKDLEKLSDLLASRERLLQAKKMLSVPIRELKQIGMQAESKNIEESCKKTLTAIQKDIEAIEEQLENIIEQNKEIDDNYKSACSVPNVGKITALLLIVLTNNFKRFANVKQLASYCGVAPFEYSSGTSVRGKTKVNHMANKRLKKALHLCAVSSLRHKSEVKIYYERKVKEGKNKMSVLNAIRNKLLQRVFACVRDKRMYNSKQVA